LTMAGRVFNIVSVYDADESRSHLRVLAREDV
jgi:head-tail adaptor